MPVISNQRIIWQLGGFYWQSQYNDVTGNSGVANSLASTGLYDAGLTSTFFIPLNEKNFLILLGQAEAASNGPGLDISSRSLTWSMAAVYGWKKRDDLMWGLGFTRGYRMGKVITVPLLMYNRSFNKNWGLESLLPIRMNVRYSIKPNSLLLAGYELEGAQYAIDDSPAYADIKNTYLQRGEIKARLSYERSLYKFIWLSAQAGMRVNGRFNFSPNYNYKEKDYSTTSVLGNPFYFNIGINWVSP